MAKLIYSTNASLDGYVADEDGNFDWAAPDEEVHRLVNDLERPVGTYLYGRGMYETMVRYQDLWTSDGAVDFAHYHGGLASFADVYGGGAEAHTPIEVPGWLADSD
jgi:hypothetical protein